LKEINDHIKNVNVKLHLLIKQYSRLVAENDHQKKTIELLNEKTVQQKQTIELLEQQQLILKASIDDMDAAEKKVLEQKINGYIRNIDKCISLLSHKQEA
jgi:hypothetical protein